MNSSFSLNSFFCSSERVSLGLSSGGPGNLCSFMDFFISALKKSRDGNNQVFIYGEIISISLPSFSILSFLTSSQNSTLPYSVSYLKLIKLCSDKESLPKQSSL